MTEGIQLSKILISDLKAHPQYDYFFDDMVGQSWQDFLQSIQENGIIDPIIVTSDNVIVSGHQRVRACKQLGFEYIIAEVKSYKNDEDVLVDLLMSNIPLSENRPCHKTKKVRIATFLEIFYDSFSLTRAEKETSRRNALRREVSKNKSNILAVHKNQCDICGIDNILLLEVHHRIPISQGGDNSISNLSVLCPMCHGIIHKYIRWIKNLENEKNQSDIIYMQDWIESHYTAKAADLLGKEWIWFLKKYPKS